MLDHTYRGIPIRHVSRDIILEVLEYGACYADGPDDVPVHPDDWFWIKMRLEIELLRRDLGLPIK